jgi:hypothetical protein
MKYRASILVEKDAEDDHPGRWDWNELVGNKVELLSVEEAEAPKLVYVLEYYHRHGTELFAFESLEDARTCMFEIIEEYAEDDLQRRGKSAEFIKDFKKKIEDRNDEVPELWYDITEENLLVHCLPIQGAKKTEEKKDG